MAKRVPEQRDDLLYIPVEMIYPFECNPNEMTARQFRLLKDHIRERGFTDSITVIKLEEDYYRIIGGEHRWKAACELGMEMIPALVLKLEDYDELTQKGELVSHNNLHGKMNNRKFIELYESVADEVGQENAAYHFGFDEEREMQKYLRDVEEGMKGTLPDGAKELADAAKVSAQDLKKIIQNMMDMFGDTVHHHFMVFVYADKPHIYVRLDDDGFAAMKRVLDYLRSTGTDINDFLGPVLKESVNQIPKAVRVSKPKGVEDPVGF